MKKINLTSSQYILLITLFFTTAGNLGLWKKIIEIVSKAPEPSCLFYSSLPIFLFFIIYIFFSIITIPYVHRVLIGILFFINGITTYAIYNFGTLIDHGMIENTFLTQKGEILSYVSINLVIWLFFLSILPFFLTLFISVNFSKNLIKGILSRILIITISGIFLLITYFSFSENYSAFGRNNSYLIKIINPLCYINETIKYIRKRALLSLKFQKIGLDAIDLNITNPKKNILILVIGETSRSMEYSLNGYTRNTNPLLSKENVTSFHDFHSCGTATAVSVPCMFSGMMRKNYNANIAERSEGLLDVLNHAGLDVSWKDNDEGCKHTCDRIPHENITKTNNPAYCHNGMCYDDILLNGITTDIQNSQKDKVIVLHLVGSHGPNYYERYPKGFQAFSPTCNKRDIQNCDHQALVNTYDNTIVYTDHIVASLINILKKQQNANASLIYLSDHGESLGESGFYLHGIPYAIAPKEETTVPFIVWLSPDTVTSRKIDMNCLTHESLEGGYSQDDLFSSVLDLMNIKTKVYNSNLDVFRKCEKIAAYHDLNSR